ncbi:MAG: hypothetical protein MHMPM18_001875 [Marteilia pararefringens]
MRAAAAKSLLLDIAKSDVLTASFAAVVAAAERRVCRRDNKSFGGLLFAKCRGCSANSDS